MSSRFAALPTRGILLAVAALVVGGAILVTRAGESSIGEVHTATAMRANLKQTITAPGAMTTAGDVRLAFKVPGRLAQVYVSVGQRVASGQALAKLDTSDLEIALAQAQAAVQAAQARYDQVAAGASPEDIGLARQAVDNADRALVETQRTAQNDVATAQQTLTRMRAGYGAARTTFTSLAQSVPNDVAALQSIVASAKQQTAPTAAEIASTTRQTADVVGARNAVLQADSSLATAMSVATGQLKSSLDDYTAARDVLVSVVLKFDGAIAAGSDPSGLASDYQLAQVSYASAATRLGGALDAVSAPLVLAQTGLSPAQSALNNAQTQTYPDLDRSRADLLGLQNTLTEALQSSAALKAKLGQAASSLQAVSDAVTGSYSAALQSASAAQERSTSSVVTAQNALGSAQASLARTSAAPRAFDVAAAYAAVLGAQAAADLTRANVDGATLRAPSAAVVAQINNRVGEQLTPTGSFVVLENVGAFVLHVTVSEGAVTMLDFGEPATVTLDALGKATLLTGRVTAIDPGATIQLGVPVYGADVTLEAPDARVRAGMSGSASVVVASRADALVIPSAAVRIVGGRRVVQLLKDGRPVETDVTVGIAGEGMTEIASGLKEGDQVVVPEPRTLLVR